MPVHAPSAQQAFLAVEGASHAKAGVVVAALSGVQAGYGARGVLNGIDLSLRPGEIVALLGRNGSGKTTLMRVLSGQIRPASGEVRVGGFDPGRDARARRLIGFVPQDIALFPRLTVRENLEVMGEMYGLPRREIARRVQQAMALTQVEDRQNDLVEHLSGGYQRRANIAGALLHDPKLLLLDEPTVGVDAETRLSLLQTLRNLRDRGACILMTTHDLDQARLLSNRVAILAGGRILEEGSLGEIVQRMFGGQRQVVVSLRSEPGLKALQVLGQFALSPTGNPLEWIGWRSDFQDLGELQTVFVDQGIEVHEIRLREPGLEQVLSRAEGGSG
jgi:ABC-2 type transport system ATP-binding protein